MTDDEKRELIAEARDVGEYLADHEYYEYRLIGRLADALEGTLDESEWEWGGGFIDDLDSSGAHPNLEEALKNVRGWNEAMTRIERREGVDKERAVLVRRRKAGPWEAVTDELH